MWGAVEASTKGAVVSWWIGDATVGGDLEGFSVDGVEVGDGCMEGWRRIPWGSHDYKRGVGWVELV